MNRREYRLGPGAASLLLVTVMVAVSLMGLLALQRARSDRELTRASFRHIEDEYATAACAEARLAELDGVLVQCTAACESDEEYIKAVAAALPEGMTIDGRTVYWQIANDDGRSLACAVEIAPLDSMPRYDWREHVFVSGTVNAAQGEQDGT